MRNNAGRIINVPADYVPPEYWGGIPVGMRMTDYLLHFQRCCYCGRPWIVFEGGFGYLDVPGLPGQRGAPLIACIGCYDQQRAEWEGQGYGRRGGWARWHKRAVNRRPLPEFPDDLLHWRPVHIAPPVVQVLGLHPVDGWPVVRYINGDGEGVRNG